MPAHIIKDSIIGCIVGCIFIIAQGFGVKLGESMLWTGIAVGLGAFVIDSAPVFLVGVFLGIVISHSVLFGFSSMAW